jgi:transcriptional regulator with XRE-family HTH domain
LSYTVRRQIDMDERIWSLRTSRGWSQRELAHRSGVAVSTVRYLELGERTPGVQTMRKLALAFGVSTLEMLEPLASHDESSEEKETG